MRTRHERGLREHEATELTTRRTRHTVRSVQSLGPLDSLAKESSSSRRVLLGWALLFVLTTTLTAMTVTPLVELVWGSPRRELVLRAFQMVSRGRARKSERRQFEDVYAAYTRLHGKPPPREGLREAISDLVEDGLLSRDGDSGLRLTPAGAATLREKAGD